MASIIHLILLLVAAANGKPAEPMESVSGISRESRQLIMLPYHGPWPADSLLMPQHGSYHHRQHDYGYYADSLMDTVHPVTQQRWMDALLSATVSKEKQSPLLNNSSGHFNSTNLNPSVASKKNSSRFTSKNIGTGSPSSSDFDLIPPQQHEYQDEYIQLEPRPDIQNFLNQTIQMIVTAIVDAIFANLNG